MLKRLSRQFFYLAVAIVIAAGSVLSAAQMVPDEPANPELAAFVAAGGSADDICGTGLPGHSHHCPYCHLLSDPDPISFAPHSERLVFGAVQDGRCDLLSGAQRHAFQISVRGPPALI
ncbi:MAG: hypothetical protein ACSHXD_11585 [Marinosulfonomonas sp.]